MISENEIFNLKYIHKKYPMFIYVILQTVHVNLKLVKK